MQNKEVYKLYVVHTGIVMCKHRLHVYNICIHTPLERWEEDVQEPLNCLGSEMLLTLGACAARVTVVVVCVCLSVCLLFDNSLHEWLFASKTNAHIQRRMEVKKYVGFSLKLLRSRVMASFTHLE